MHSCTTPISSRSSSGQQKYYILDGQHAYTASQRIRQEREAEGKSVPRWAQQFRCQVVKPGLTLDVLQQIAGSQQGKAVSTKTSSLTEAMTLYLKEVEASRAAKEGTGQKEDSRFSLLVIA